jgi:hypothetical protein
MNYKLIRKWMVDLRTNVDHDDKFAKYVLRDILAAVGHRGGLGALRPIHPPKKISN